MEPVMKAVFSSHYITTGYFSLSALIDPMTAIVFPVDSTEEKKSHPCVTLLGARSIKFINFFFFVLLLCLNNTAYTMCGTLTE